MEMSFGTGLKATRAETKNDVIPNGAENPVRNLLFAPAGMNRQNRILGGKWRTFTVSHFSRCLGDAVI
jgi:hypothetical protein